MPWLELAVSSRYPEFAEELLSAAGAQAISQTDEADDPVLEPAPGDTPLWRQTLTTGLFGMDADLRAIRRLLRESLPYDSGLGFAERLVDDQDWVRTWLNHARPLQFGEKLWVCPNGYRVTVDGAIVVTLDPGLAFGTGDHPSTALCLDWLATARLAGSSVLDYGCGSGILAIAALRLGAERAEATDVDPQALQATSINAQRNGVHERLTTTTPAALLSRQPQFDVLLANILAGTLVELAPRLITHVANGGHIILSGILPRQTAEVREAYARWFEFNQACERDGWARLIGRRRAGN